MSKVVNEGRACFVTLGLVITYPLGGYRLIPLELDLAMEVYPVIIPQKTSLGKMCLVTLGSWYSVLLVCWDTEL